jgi:hypothetical protein
LATAGCCWSNRLRLESCRASRSKKNGNGHERDETECAFHFISPKDPKCPVETLKHRNDGKSRRILRERLPIIKGAYEGRRGSARHAEGSAPGTCWADEGDYPPNLTVSSQRIASR